MSLIEFLCFGQRIGKRTRCSEYCHPVSLPLYPSASPFCSPVPSTAFFAIAWVGCELNEVTFVAAGHLCNTPPAHTPKHTHTQRSSPFSCETLTQLTSLATCVNILSASAGAGPQSTTPPTTGTGTGTGAGAGAGMVCVMICVICIVCNYYALSSLKSSIVLYNVNRFKLDAHYLELEIEFGSNIMAYFFIHIALSIISVGSDQNKVIGLGCNLRLGNYT